MVVAVGILFVIRKYLYVSFLDSRRRRREARVAAAIREEVFGSMKRKEKEKIDEE